MLRRRRAPLLLAAAAAGVALATASPSGDNGRSVASTLRHGVARSSRAVYTIGFVVADYKYSLRGLDSGSADYRVKLSEVHLRSAKKLLKLCEVNGGFYVKAGQYVSSLRQVPKEYSSTLSCLQDQATPSKFQDIKIVIEQNFGRRLHEIFLEFDEHPIAAASIAQVHRGRLHDNQDVAVKESCVLLFKKVTIFRKDQKLIGNRYHFKQVQYPGLEQRMKIDIMTMSFLSKSVSWIFPDYKFERLLAEFEKSMSMELDFTLEAKNSERTANCFRKKSVIKVPYVFWQLTTREVLTMEFCYGHKVAKALIELFGEMVFVHGFVHGDPHPGNILVSPQGHGKFSLVLLDHGIYRELDQKFRLDYCQLWKALILLDTKKILELGEQFGVGKYAKYFPVIFTGRTLESKSALGTQMSSEEQRRLKEDLSSLGMDDISSFMEALPRDFYVILRTDGLLRSILGNLGAPRHVRLLTYAKCAIHGLEKQPKLESGTINQMFVQVKTNISYLHLRVLIEIAGLLAKVNDAKHKAMNKLRKLFQEISRGIHLLT
ncbi:aarF domain-containing protein kinase 1-like isoform X2 [Panicum virgatum]|uniref:aarF domain-containing protein kinase 1-like isoform X2 n=1 Tax=Panicum virgatum TaxID=38727 RepID=UPI0019D5CFEA|nr:aarF domain-containing protein kinase 1-like isoform X2 [Panicum virgatum]